MLTNGCTFALLDGNGSVARESVATFLPKDADANQIAQWKQDLCYPPPLGGGFTKQITSGDFSGYTAQTMYTPFWPYLAGPYRTLSLKEPAQADSKKRAFLNVMDVWGVGFPLFSNWRGACYDVKTGECVSGAHIVTLTLLMMYTSGVDAAKQASDAHYPLLNSDVRTTDVKYDRISAYCVGLGALAWGQKNSRAYFQVAWIPIPLWSLE
jgi:hypothetical protein